MLAVLQVRRQEGVGTMRVQDDRLLIYTYPACALVDAQLLPRTVITRDIRYMLASSAQSSIQ
jgi:hypothetical protein